MDSYVVDEIIEVTKDAKSRAFWEKAIRVLGEGVVAEEFSELKYQMNTRGIREPAKYLTALLKKQMGKRAAVGQATPPVDQGRQPDKLKGYFESTQLALFTSLVPVKKAGEVDQKVMVVPYGKEIIPWATFISACFFTLSTNKAKSDRVLAKFRTLDGDVSVIPLLRGKFSPGGAEYGILTAEHGKILAAIESIWVQQGCQYNKYPSGAVSCFCYVSIRELANLLGWKKFGGSALVWLKDRVFQLKSRPYYMDLSALGIKNMTGYGFTLLGDVELADGKKHGQPETVLKIKFSTPLSVQLLNRRAVSRPKELSRMHSELAFLLRLHLEPILISLNGGDYSKTLKDLIKELALPCANWHKHKGKRKAYMEGAVRELNTHKTADGRPIVVGIEKGLFDWVLVARLGGEDKCLELRAPQPATRQ